MKIVQIITDYIRRSILTTQGDMVVRGASLPERLVAVAVGQVLKSGGVGALPAWGVPNLSENGIGMGSYDRNSSGGEVISSLTFRPSLILFHAQDLTLANMNWSIGWDDGTNHYCQGIHKNGTESVNSDVVCLFIKTDASNIISGAVSALSDVGFTITHTLTGAKTTRVHWLAIG